MSGMSFVKNPIIFVSFQNPIDNIQNQNQIVNHFCGNRGKLSVSLKCLFFDEYTMPCRRKEYQYEIYYDFNRDCFKFLNYLQRFKEIRRGKRGKF